MEAKEFEFLFRHRGRKFTGTLEVMRPFKTRMYRVYVERADGRDDAIFIFYEVNEPGQRFFHYPQD
ncbi:MAG: hypothetical protein J7502_09310, partial [Flavisolibacter sp.]|nr:hypothetical protein [Flavisolibacter sp.]